MNVTFKYNNDKLFIYHLPFPVVLVRNLVSAEKHLKVRSSV